MCLTYLSREYLNQIIFVTMEQFMGSIESRQKESLWE